ncbi:MAG: UDP-N-acetylmuramate dehydrogenase, partial [bacterium]
MKSITELSKIAGAEVKEKEPLAKWTTFKIGGPAKYFVVIRSIEKLGAVLNFCREKKMPYIILGGGSNLLIGEKGFAGLAIRLMADNFLVTENKITVDAGMSLTRLVGLTAQCSLSGLEWAAGIPGTVGGAVHGNAGAYGGSMSQCVNAVTIWRDGKIVKLNKEDCHFIYRGSIFKATHNKDVILSAELVLNLGEEKTIRAKMMEIIIRKRPNLAMLQFPENYLFRVAVLRGSTDLYECYIEEA